LQANTWNHSEFCCAQFVDRWVLAIGTYGNHLGLALSVTHNCSGTDNCNSDLSYESGKRCLLLWVLDGALIQLHLRERGLGVVEILWRNAMVLLLRQSLQRVLRDRELWNTDLFPYECAAVLRYAFAGLKQRRVAEDRWREAVKRAHSCAFRHALLLHHFCCVVVA
jgi:hypothetical protein